MSCKSTLDPCSLSKTLRCVFSVDIYSVIIQAINAAVITSSVVGASNCLILFHSQCQVDVYINEKAGINFIEVKGGLSTKAMANAITKTHADKEVQHAVVQN